jgi:peptidase M1-like protein/surface antigen Omp85-like protein
MVSWQRCWALLALLTFGFAASPVRAQALPKDLPRYDVVVELNTATRHARVDQIVSWTNTTNHEVNEIVFNAHARYSIPEKEIGFLAKTVEILRMSPKESLNFEGAALSMSDVRYHGKTPTGPPRDNAGVPIEPKRDDRLPTFEKQKPPPLKPGIEPRGIPFHFPPGNATALTIPLPERLAPGETVKLQLNFEIKIPAKKGRWGQWDGITTLTQWLPVVAVHDGVGWQPTPFIPWHQPFFNEAGIYQVRVMLPRDQKLAASAPVKSVSDIKDGWKLIEHEEICVRDFSLVASARFEEWTGEADGVKIRVLAPPEHAFYAKAFVETVEESLPVYNQWFGRFPYKHFTVVEACLGWAGNESGGMVLIDDRIFNMPHVARSYPVYLLQHELAHQWWYNAVGTNGYAETWMDEGLATYFSHRLADRMMGRNNELIKYPTGLGWLPNIRREDFRNFGMVGVWARGQAHPPVQEMEKYGHLVNLTSATYDRGGSVVGMIEERLGEKAFIDFMRHIYSKYRFRILRVKDFQQELETFTRYSWDDFFLNWVYGTGRCDWAVERVEINDEAANVFRLPRSNGGQPVRVTVYLKQQGDFNEPTSVGFRITPSAEYQVRVPIHPDVPSVQFEELHAQVVCTTEQVGGKQRARAKVEITLPNEPEQISVDPDRVLIDEQPANNHWKRQFRWHLTPFYTQLDEVDVTNSYDRWNIQAGPWLYFSSYNDPWYTKSLMAGLRAGLFRTQELNAAAFLAYRSNDRNIIAGADVFWDHAILPQTQLGFALEKSLATVGGIDIPTSRAVAYARHVLMYGSSLYLPPFEYIEGFGVIQNRCLPDPREPTPGAELFRDRTALGVHYHKNLMTPYWDAEGGYSLDATYQYGLPIFGTQAQFQQVYGQFAFVKGMGFVRDWLGEGPVASWLADTRWAFRAGGALALPNNGQFFSLGGGDNFRGFDLAERQGSMLWIGSVEWRVPIAVNRQWDFVDHIGSVRNVYAAPFYDVGNAYVNSHQLGPIAHAVGAGLRVDVNWLGLIERTTLRFDVAKTVNGTQPWQFWFGIQHPF